MARLVTCGWETGGAESHVGGVALTQLVPDTAVKRTGAYSLKLPSSGTGGTYWATGAALGTRIYVSFWIYIDATPAGNAQRLAAFGSAANAASGPNIMIDIDRTVYCNWPTLRGVHSSPIALNAWHRIEMMCKIDTGALDEIALYVDGVECANLTALSVTDTANYTFFYISTVSATGYNCWYDDFKMNDGSGATDNGWPPLLSGLLLLEPTADSAIGTGWTGGAGGTTNLWDALNNNPPTAGADPGTNATQIRNATDAAANYDATLQSYTAVGIGAGDTINGVHPIINTAAPIATGAKLGAVEGVSNPVVTSKALTSNSGQFYAGAVAGAFPTGWKTSWGTYVPSPSVTRGTAPVVRADIVSGTATRIAMVASLGLYVEYTVSAVGPVTIPLDPSAAITTPLLAIFAPTTILLGTAGAVAAPAMALRAPTQIVFASSAAVAAGTLVLSASAQALIPLGSAPAVSGATLALTAPGKIAGTAGALSAATLTLSVPTRVVLATCDAVSASILALRAATRVVLGSADALSTAVVALRASAALLLSPSAGVTSGAISITARPQIALQSATALSAASLTLSPLAVIVLGQSNALSAATLVVTPKLSLDLQPSAAVSQGTLVLVSKTTIPLNPSQAVSTGTLAVSVKTGLSLSTSTGLSAASVNLGVVPTLVLNPSSAFASGTLELMNVNYLLVEYPAPHYLQSSGIETSTMLAADSEVGNGENHLQSGGLSTPTLLAAKSEIVESGIISAGLDESHILEGSVS